MRVNLRINFDGTSLETDLNTFYDLALPLREGNDNPNCYYAEPPVFQTIEFGESFIGSVKRGGSCNYQKISFTPHGNGTHTECYGHVSADGYTMQTALQKFHFSALLLSITPETLPNEDRIVLLSQIKVLELFPRTEALIIRTLPNEEEKKNKQYSGTNPTYFSAEIGTYLRERGIKHFLTDMPSVDRESDGGKLSFHKNFWNYPTQPEYFSTITELIFVPNAAQDGLYLLNLQTPPLCADAAPSRPVIFPLHKLKE